MSRKDLPRLVHDHIGRMTSAARQRLREPREAGSQDRRAGGRLRPRSREVDHTALAGEADRGVAVKHTRQRALKEPPERKTHFPNGKGVLVRRRRETFGLRLGRTQE